VKAIHLCIYLQYNLRTTSLISNQWYGWFGRTNIRTKK